ncbi:spinster 1 domain like protein [Oesophagostomum dentatum]|uniref:Spinster 1 domain like protein n=1 Tax=Oesophagostomum dentatum TaxID=61180 RepID=A0A0B1SX21_OESDE|nr:spinster 1 domain like protein [Oesophagostomum dentatum]
MFCSPLCGFFGDRYTRKWIIVCGMLLWISAVFASTFVPKEKFWLFLILRGMVGIGEASYSTTAPSVIGDMFAGHSRSRMLMVFSFAIPCGRYRNSLDYSLYGIVHNSKSAGFNGDNHFGVMHGVICLVLTVAYVEEPHRGAAEKEKGDIAISATATTYLDDLNDLLTNRTYVFGTAGYTAIVFAVGTLSWWGPSTILHSEAHKLRLNSTDMLPPEKKAL